MANDRPITTRRRVIGEIVAGEGAFDTSALKPSQFTPPPNIGSKLMDAYRAAGAMVVCCFGEADKFIAW
jgi:hypothetical protein